MKKLMKKALFIFTLIMLLSCNTGRKSDEAGDPIVAVIGAEKIHQSLIDEIISEEIRELRSRALKTYLEESLYTREAREKKVTIEQLINDEIISPNLPLTREDIIKHINLVPELEVTDENIIEVGKYLEDMIFREESRKYFNTLISKYNVEIFLPSPIPGIIDLSDLPSHTKGNPISPNHIYIVSNPDCPSCCETFREFKNIYEEYKKDILLHYILFSPGDENAVLACEAAGKQNYFWEMAEIVFSHHPTDDQSYYGEIVEKLGLDPDQFYKDMDSPELRERITLNYEILLERGIMELPAIILDNRILEKISIEKLRELLDSKIYR